MEWYNAGQVAKILGVQRQTVINWINGGHLRADYPRTRREGFYISTKDVEKFLDANPCYAYRWKEMVNPDYKESDPRAERIEELKKLLPDLKRAIQLIESL